MMDPLFWRVHLADGRTMSEPVWNSSIREAPRSAVRLDAVTPLGQVVRSIELKDARPIWYRLRSMEPGSSIALDATVFGRGWETDSRVEGTLWAAVGGQIVDCPKRLIDQTMVELQVVGA